MVSKNINNYLFIPLLFLSLLLQLTIVPRLFFSLIVPDLVLILLIAASFLSKSADIFYISFFSGLILDVFSASSFGATTISIVSAIFVSSYLGYRFLKELLSVNLFIISSSCVLFYNVIHFVSAMMGGSGQMFGNLDQFAAVAVTEIIYTIILIYPLTYIISLRRQ